MHPDELRTEMNAEEYDEFVSYSEARRELKEESMD
jgi:hypothetical protein